MGSFPAVCEEVVLQFCSFAVVQSCVVRFGYPIRDNLQVEKEFAESTPCPRQRGIYALEDEITGCANEDAFDITIPINKNDFRYFML